MLDGATCRQIIELGSVNQSFSCRIFGAEEGSDSLGLYGMAFGEWEHPAAMYHLTGNLLRSILIIWPHNTSCSQLLE